MSGLRETPERTAIDTSVLESLAADIGADECDRILQMFKENLREYCGEMESEIASQDLPGAKRLAHGIKGLCLQFGATHSMEIARLIELDVENAEEATAALQKLVAEIERVEAFIASWGTV